MFDEELCQQGKQFANKIWNAFRLIKGWEVMQHSTTSNSPSRIGLVRSKVSESTGRNRRSFL